MNQDAAGKSGCRRFAAVYGGRRGGYALKVLMIPSWYPTPGAPLLGTFYKEQAEALAERGFEVAVAHVSVGNDFHPGHNGVRREMVNGVLTYTYTRPNLTPRWERGRCFQRSRMLEALYRRIEKEWGRPDVVNLRSSLHGYEAIALCRKHHLPLFFMEHSSYVLTEPADSPALRRLHAVMKAARVNACVSGALKEVMEPAGETRIIPDPVDGRVFAPAEKAAKRDEAPASDMAETPFVFRAMGQLRPIKGYDTLIRAFARLRERESRDSRPAVLEIAGVGGQQDALQTLIDELGLSDSCRLVGAVPREQAADYMNGCDCFVCSSRVETLSCVLNEAAACGKPVISTRCGGPLDIVTEEIGLLTPVDDPEAMAQAMRSMRDTIGQYDPARIRALTLERFGRDTVVDRLAQACRDAAVDGKDKNNKNSEKGGAVGPFEPPEGENRAEVPSPDKPNADGATPGPPARRTDTRKLLAIFGETLKIGLVTIGGGYAMISLISECYARKRRWLDEEEMIDALAVAQSLPGPIGLNASVMAGYRAAGVKGGLLAGLGMTLPPLFVMSVIAACYTWFRANPYVAAAMEGIQACVCGLLAWATVSLGRAAIVGVDSIGESVPPPSAGDEHQQKEETLLSRRKRRIRCAWTSLVFAGALAAALLTRLDAVLLILAGLLLGLVVHAVSSLAGRRVA